MMGLKESLKKRKATSRSAVGGLDNVRLLNPVRQAPLPAFALGPLIRGLEIDKAMRITGVEFVLGIEERMTLIAVDQTSKWRVKTEALYWASFKPQTSAKLLSNPVREERSVQGQIFGR